MNRQESSALPLSFPLPVEAVVIDLDGTLLDTAPDLAYAANRMLAELNQPPLDKELVASYVGNGVSRLVKRVLTKSRDGEPDSEYFARALPIFEKYYGAHVSQYSRPFPGILEGIKALRARGFRLACVTNKAERFTIPLLKDTDLLDAFELVLSGDSLPKTKPDPLPLLHTIRHFAVTAQQLLMIGDSINDIQAARSAGCPVFCVTYGYQGGHAIDHADALLSSLLDALPLIKKAV